MNSTDIAINDGKLACLASILHGSDDADEAVSDTHTPADSYEMLHTSFVICFLSNCYCYIECPSSSAKFLAYSPISHTKVLSQYRVYESNLSVP